MNEAARLAALEAVAEAARNYVERRGKHYAWPDLIAALEALDALPAPTPGETVEVQARVSRSESGNSMRVYGMTIDGGKTWSFDSGPHIAIITASVLLPTTPTITATVTLKVTP